MCNPPCWPGRTEPSRAGPEPSRAEPNQAEPGRAKPGQAEPSRAAMSRAEPSRAKEGCFLLLCLSPCSGSICTSLSMLHAGGVSLRVGVYSPQKGNAFKICQNGEGVWRLLRLGQIKGPRGRETFLALSPLSAGPGQAGPSRAELGRAQAKPSRAGPSRAGPGRAKLGRAPAKPSQAKLSWARPRVCSPIC